MKAAVMRELSAPLEIEELSTDKPGAREVLVRTAACGVCHSDLHFMEGKYPFPCPAVLGHESAGVVEAVGSMVHYVQPGDHVIEAGPSGDETRTDAFEAAISQMANWIAQQSKPSIR